MTPPKTFRQDYVDLIQRHLGRDPNRSDGVTEAALSRCERRLGVRLPTAMREYYLIAGRLDQLNKSHNLLFNLDELRIEDRHLWFMEENQAVVHWGLPATRLSNDDPIVHQRVNEAGAKWYSEKMRFSKFLTRVYDWQAGLVDDRRD
jgi:hypothetical protein